MVSHDDLRGMIPWLLNGTLDGDERRQVLEHLAGCAACKQDLADTRLAAEIFDQHPPAAALVALAWDETPEGIDPGFLAGHLEICASCAAELEMARMSRRFEEDGRIAPLVRRPKPAADTPVWRGWKAAALAASLAGAVAANGWFQASRLAGSLERKLAGQVEAPAAGATPGAETAEAARARQLAAELDQKLREVEGQAATLRAQEKELRGRLDEMAQARTAPQPVGRIENLQPLGDVVRGGEAGGAPTLAARTSTVLLLDAAHAETHSGHAVDIVDAAGRAVWSAAELPRDGKNSLYVLSLPAGALATGSYTIRVYGTGAAGREPVESYAIRVD